MKDTGFINETSQKHGYKHHKKGTGFLEHWKEQYGDISRHHTNHWPAQSEELDTAPSSWATDIQIASRTNKPKS